MPTLSIPNTFVSETDAEAAEVNSNFSTIAAAVNTYAMQKDGTNTALDSGIQITATADPTAAGHLARKAYVDAEVAAVSAGEPAAHTHGSADLTSLPNHSAALLTSGALPAARLPNHSAALLTSGQMPSAQLPDTIQVTNVGVSGKMYFADSLNHTIDYNVTTASLFSFRKDAAKIATLGTQGISYDGLGQNDPTAKIAFEHAGLGVIYVYLNGAKVGGAINV